MCYEVVVFSFLLFFKKRVSRDIRVARVVLIKMGLSVFFDRKAIIFAHATEKNYGQF